MEFQVEEVMFILAIASGLAGGMFAAIFSSFQVFLATGFFAALMAVLGVIFMYS